MTFVFRIAAIVFMLAAGFAGTHATHAAPVSLDIKFEEGGSVVGFGKLTIDKDLFDGIGNDTYSPTTGLLSLDFILNGVSFDITDDFAFGEFPEVNFIDGLFTGLNFVGESDGATAIVTGFTYWFIDAEGGETAGTVAVPEPSSMLAFAMGLVALGGLVRRKIG
jgi:PEP-CTERM motif